MYAIPSEKQIFETANNKIIFFEKLVGDLSAAEGWSDGNVTTPQNF